MIVIDASALTAVMLKEDCWRGILELSDIFVSLDFSLLETANAIRTAQVKGRIDREQSLKAIEILMEFASSNMILKPSNEIVSESFRIAIEEGITVYDASYILLAKREGLPLLTLDRKQLYTALKLGVPVKTMQRL